MQSYLLISQDARHVRVRMQLPNTLPALPSAPQDVQPGSTWGVSAWGAQPQSARTPRAPRRDCWQKEIKQNITDRRARNLQTYY